LLHAGVEEALAEDALADHTRGSEENGSHGFMLQFPATQLTTVSQMV
jgi:hypothetical protein